MPVQMELARVLISETQGTHYVELREVDPPLVGQPRRFPIVIGLIEAAAIERRLMNQVPPRPQTHELLSDVIEKLGYRLDRVIISDLSEHTFFARLRLRSTREPSDCREVDSRPSDAIALGAAYDVPIEVADHVIDEVCREA